MALQYLEKIWKVYVQYSVIWTRGNLKTKATEKLDTIYACLSPLRDRLRCEVWMDEQRHIASIAAHFVKHQKTLSILGSRPETMFRVRGGEPEGQDHLQNMVTVRKNAQALTGVLHSFHLRKCHSPR